MVLSLFLKAVGGKGGRGEEGEERCSLMSFMERVQPR